MNNTEFTPRHAARIVLLDESGQVAIIHVEKSNYYKIPGGGVEEGEDFEAAALREAAEESGCNCEIIQPLGKIETDLPDWKLHDISRGFIAKVIGEKSQTNFDDYEKARGFNLEWAPSLDRAIQIFEGNHSVSEVDAKKLQDRDLAFLKLASDYFAQK